ncbi:MAG: EAL domain-containing response regulator [Gammaproteobacteria bacterium]|nr:EAL domain-containing response regulator [Gammaproteobacteria bacterium]
MMRSQQRETASRLLVLDDDPDIGQTVRNMAENLGYQCRVTTRPDDFFEALDGWRPSHILLDLVMPEMDGMEVIRHLADRRCDATLIISSGLGNRVIDAASRAASQHQLNMAGVLAKPFSIRDLRALLGRQPPASPVPRPVAGAMPEITPAMLADAIQTNQIGLVYQPKVRCAEDTVTVGFEALARWTHPQWGPIPPDRFILLAEREGLIEPLTRKVLVQACATMAAIRRTRGRAADDWSMAVNLSARCLTHFDMADKLVTLCQLHGLEPRHLTLELTETAAMEDGVLALDLLTRLRMKGFQLAIDDFGVGYSSMVQLARLPFSELKLDKAFVIAADHSREARTIIKSAVDLGHQLDLKVIAEGVETDAALAFLRETGCDFMQGYYIARPMEGEDIGGWLEDREGRC